MIGPATATGKGKPSRLHAEVFDEAGALDVEGRTEPGSQAVQLYDLIQLAHHFGVSRASALYRLRNLRVVSQQELERLKSLDADNGKQLAARLGLPELDPWAERNAFRHRFLGLALEAYRRDEISRAKLRELGALVALSPADLDQLIEYASLDDPDDLPLEPP